MKKLGRGIVFSTLLIVIVISLTRLPNHFDDLSWPAHAKSHLTSQIFLVLGGSLALAAELWRRRNTCTPLLLGYLVVYGLFMFGGYWAGKFLFEGDVWRSGNTTFLLLMVSYFVGVALLGADAVKGRKL